MKEMILIIALMVFVLISVNALATVSLSVTSQTIPSIIEPGERANIILTITNNGNDYARNLKLRIKSHSFIKPDQYNYELQTISASSSQQVTIPIKVDLSASEGTTALFFTMEYSEGSSAGTVTKENSISILITKRVLIQIDNVTFNDDMIEQGDDIVMTVNLKNIGKGRIKDLRLSLEDFTLPFVYVNNEKYVGDLASGQSARASFNIIINKDAKTIAYNMPMNLSYYDESGILHTEQKRVGLKISGSPEFVVSIEKTEKMYAGNIGKLSISISNRGTSTAQFLTAEFDSGLDINPKEFYIGNLDPDDSSTISIEVDLRKNNAGLYPLNITLKYKDPYNKEFTENRSLKLNIVSQPFEISASTQVIIIVIVLGVLYWKRNFVFKLLKRK